MNNNIDSICESIGNYIAKQEDVAVRKALINTEGRIPPMYDLMRHGRWLIHQNGTKELQWKGKVILKIKPYNI